jgi:hypothetical protein
MWLCGNGCVRICGKILLACDRGVYARDRAWCMHAWQIGCGVSCKVLGVYVCDSVYVYTV